MAKELGKTCIYNFQFAIHVPGRVWGGTAFAKRSAAMKAPVGLLSGSAVCDSRWRGVALTSAAPTRSLRKCRRIAEVKSRRDRTFSRIENLWPRDGSCPLPLRSKSFPGNCFRIVKTQKISKRSLLMYGSHRLLRTKFLPLFCSGVVRLAHGKRKVVARYHVQTAYEGFKVRYEESRAQRGHCVLLLSSTRITL